MRRIDCTVTVFAGRADDSTEAEAVWTNRTASDTHPRSMARIARIGSDLRLNAVEILVLTSFGIAQPLFSLLARSSAFFVVHRTQQLDLLGLVLIVCLLPAGALVLIECITARILPRATASLHLGILSLLLTINVIEVVRRIALPGMVALTLASIGGTALAALYVRIRNWRTSLVYLTPAVPLFPTLLLFFSPASGILFPGRAPKALAAHIENPVPIVFVVFDEFPLASLLDKNRLVDSRLYPNFAELSRTATWYRNTTTVGESTLLALPAIVSGRYPDPDNPKLPAANYYPKNLFTLLGGSYAMNVTENDTRLCPEQLCGDPDMPWRARMADLLRDAGVLSLYAILPADFTHGLPDITQSWQHFQSQPVPRPTLEMWTKYDDLTDWHDRVKQFRAFTDSIRPSGLPTLHFLHILLPHAPWEYLPSGQKCCLPESRIRGLRGTNDRGEDPNQWTDDQWAVAQNYQRHLLQVGLADRLVGSLLTRLRDQKIYDRSLVIVTADHGCSFRTGDSRRTVTETNQADILSVPLFIKYPAQKRGVLDDRLAENVDIFPTILNVIGMLEAQRTDGQSLVPPKAPARETRTVVTGSGKRLSFPAGLDSLFASVDVKLAMFGGEAGFDVFRLGDRFGWTGRPVPAAIPLTAGIKYRIDRETYYRDVDLDAPVVLTYVTGQILRDDAAKPQSAQELAVAVNGTLRAITESYWDGRELFAAMLPKNALRAGANDIQVFSVGATGSLGKLERVGTPLYEWGRTLRFGAGGDADPYYGIGWGQPEDGITWTDGRVATLYLPTRQPDANGTLTVTVSGFTVPGKFSRQRVRVLINEKEVAHWKVTGEPREYAAPVARECIKGPVAEITFELPDATSPKEAGNGADARALGLAFRDIRLTFERGR